MPELTDELVVRLVECDDGAELTADVEYDEERRAVTIRKGIGEGQAFEAGMRIGCHLGRRLPLGKITNP